MAQETLRKREQKDCMSQNTRKSVVKQSCQDDSINKIGTVEISMDIQMYIHLCISNTYNQR